MSFLERIVTARRKFVDELDDSADAWDAAARRQPEPRDFRGALTAGGMSLIAEIKRRSPSAGPLSTVLGIGDRARAYERGGAHMISVLCDAAFFDGSPEHLIQARAATSLPLLFKDFVVDEVQLDVARGYGADAVLLIARCLEPSRFRALARGARERDLLPTPVFEAIADAVDHLGPRPRMSDLAPRRILEAIAHDKKARAGRVPFILPTAIGRVVVKDDVSRGEIERALRLMAKREGRA